MSLHPHRFSWPRSIPARYRFHLTSSCFISVFSPPAALKHFHINFISRFSAPPCRKKVWNRRLENIIREELDTFFFLPLSSTVYIYRMTKCSLFVCFLAPPNDLLVFSMSSDAGLPAKTATTSLGVTPVHQWYRSPGLERETVGGRWRARRLDP